MTLTELINSFETTPFLFVGSGMTRRYLNLPDWKGLLEYFARKVSDNDFSYSSYENRAKTFNCPQGIFPKVAELIQHEYDEKWFHNPDIRTADPAIQEQIKNGLSPFKAEIAAHIQKDYALNPEYSHEIELLQKISEKSIAGVITTNYDTFLEDTFKGFKKYIGQNELIFSTLQGVAEIYKIHGSVEDPESIIINEADYNRFNSQSAYLAAKLMTIFVEYPIIFLGYSISDQNVRNIMESIVKCLTPEQIETLKRRFVFVEYRPDAEAAEISSFSILVNGKDLPMTKITLSNFEPLYEAIGKKKSKLPVRLLRSLKQELYEYVITNTPTANLRVASIDDSRLGDEEMVLAIGRADQFGLRGLSGIDVNEWYRNIILNDIGFTADELLEYSFPKLIRQNSGTLPVNKYLSEATKSFPACEELSVLQTFDTIINNTIKKNRRILGTLNSVKQIWESNKDNLHRATYLMSHLPEDSIDIDELETFLIHVFKKDPDVLSNEDSGIRTEVRRLVRILDYLKWGKAKEPSDSSAHN